MCIEPSLQKAEVIRNLERQIERFEMPHIHRKIQRDRKCR